MKKFLLSVTAMAIPALMSAAAPEGALYLLGLNGVDTPDESLALAFDENRTEDDIDEGVYRWNNPEIALTQAGNFNVATADKSLVLGYDPDNFMGAPNDLSSTSTMMYLCKDGQPINCTLNPGNYSVSVILFEADPEDPESADSWIIQMKSLDAEEETGSYYLLGFGGDDEEADASNKFVKSVEVIDGETVISYTIPKFKVGACPGGFTVYDKDNDVTLGGDSAPVTDENPMAMLSENAAPVPCALTEGYYTVNFFSQAGFAMISFLLCEDQTPVDESEYYLVGFNGIDKPEDSVKFVRTVETEEYEEDGEKYSSTVISYSLDNFNIDSCENGFTVTTASGDFYFGLDPAFAPVLGTSVTAGFGFLGIYGAPVGFEMEKGVYNVKFNINTAGSAMISFMAPEDDPGSVEDIEGAVSSRPQYFNLQGVRVENPSKGIFIKVQDGKSSKVVIR